MSGHIRRRGGSWEIKFALGRDPATGKRKTAYRSFKGTKKEVQVELTRLLAERDRGTSVDPTRMTVADFLDRWLRDWVATNVSLRSAERYGSIVALQIIPHLGQLPIQSLRPAHLADLYTKLAATLATRTVSHVHKLLRSALKRAAQWGIVQTNVASLVSPPRVQASEIAILRETEITTLLNKLREAESPSYMVAVLGLGTGLRRGEMLALRWQDVDFVGGRLRVERSLEQTKAGGLRFKVPKTRAGKRFLALPSSIAAELRAHRTAQQEQRLARGLGRVPDDALVISQWDGQPRPPSSVSREWAETMARLGFKITLHALRHTHASQLIAAGMDVLTISRRLGHASPVITLGVYGHLFANTDDKAAEIIEAAFTRMRTEQGQNPDPSGGNRVAISSRAAEPDKSSR
jgi:integrase